MSEVVYILMEAVETCCSDAYEVLLSDKVFKTEESAIKTMREIVEERIKDYTVKPIWTEEDGYITLSFTHTCKKEEFYVVEHKLYS